MPTPRALLVDLGNVLVRFDHGLTLDRIARAAGVEPAAIKPHLFGGLEHDFGVGRIGAREYFRAAEAGAGLAPIPDEVWEPAWRDIFTPIPESIALLSRLAPGIATCLVSNTNALHWEGVKRVCPIETLLQHHALSFEVGAAKPDPAIFRWALQRVGAEPREAVFADDLPELVDAARALGLDAFVVDSPATFERELQRRRMLI